MAETIERELGWDDEIEHDGNGGYLLVPAGDYDFTVQGFERGRYSGSAKIPACNQATLKLEIATSQGTAIVLCNLFLHSNAEWKLCEFFTSIGQRKHGEKLKMDWQKVQGARGRCKINIRKWVNDKGDEIQSSQVAEFYEPTKAAPAFTPGAF